MCGLAGMMATEGAADAAAVAKMADAIAHRGPDGRRDYALGNVAMTHLRLAIIDLQTGDQPLHEPGGAALVANGEIYNYVELRESLPGVKFSTHSDCELPLHLYRREGVDFVRRLRGMYAIAIHDPREGRLVLSRDPFGIKPLYYAEIPQGLIFASELQAVLASGLVPRRLDAERRDELLELQFTTGTETVFRGVHRLAPGETIVAVGGRIIERHAMPALPEGPPRKESEDESLRRLDAALMESVRLHQRSDVPYGMFLSGGVDSAALLAVMARLNERAVRAFTVGFSGSSVPDERTHARMLAKSVGAEHVEVEFGEADFWRLLPRIAGAMDDPAADYATLPTYLLGEIAGRDLKVVLCGEGGDEMFAGYGRYRKVSRPWWLGGRPLRLNGILERAGIRREGAGGWRDGIVAAEARARFGSRTRLQIAQAVDCADWLPADLLTKLDRCLMAHGVEGRVPFLDAAVADAAFLLPDRLKVRGNLGKYLLRRWLARALPEAKPFSRKRGFTVPVLEWIARKGRDLGPLVAADPAVEEICPPEAVRAMYADARRAGLAPWVLLFYALWHRRHVLGLRDDGDVFESLAQHA